MSYTRVPEGDRERIGKNIRRIRVIKEISQEHLAEAAEYDQSSLSKVERGIIEPSLGKVLLFCKVMGVTPNMLLEGCYE